MISASVARRGKEEGERGSDAWGLRVRGGASGHALRDGRGSRAKRRGPRGAGEADRAGRGVGLSGSLRGRWAVMREEERDGPRERLGQPERRKGKGGGWAGLSLGWAGEKGSGPAGWASNWVWFLPLFFFLIQTKLILLEFKSKFEFNTNTQTNKRDAPA